MPNLAIFRPLKIYCFELGTHPNHSQKNDVIIKTIVKEIYKCYNNKMAYSTDYRQMILDKHEAGRSIRSLAQEFNISTRTLQNWKKQPERKVVKTRKGKIDMALLKQDVEKYPDSYQRERAVRFNCTQRAIGIALKRLKITQKKDT